MSVYSLVYMFLVKERGHNICCSSDIMEEWHGEVPKKKEKQSKGHAVLHPKTTGLSASTGHRVEHKCVTNKACFRSLSLVQCCSLLVKSQYCRDIWHTLSLRSAHRPEIKCIEHKLCTKLDLFSRKYNFIL